MTDLFDFARYQTDEIDLKTYCDDKLTDLLTKLTDGPLTIPRPCGDACRGPRCSCVKRQFARFKQRVQSERTRFTRSWFSSQDGVLRWRPEEVLRSFMRAELDLHADIPDIVELCEICLVLCRSQSDTERVGKTSKQVIKNRFEGKHDETRSNAQDRAAGRGRSAHVGLSASYRQPPLASF